MTELSIQVEDVAIEDVEIDDILEQVDDLLDAVDNLPLKDGSRVSYCFSIQVEEPQDEQDEADDDPA